MDYDEADDRLARAERRIRDLERTLEDELEERRRVLGQLYATLTEVRTVLRRLEEWQETTDDKVREVRVSMRAAGSVFMIPNRTN